MISRTKMDSRWSKPTVASLSASVIACELNFTCRPWRPLEYGCGKLPLCTTHTAHEQIYSGQARRELGQSRPHIRCFAARPAADRIGIPAGATRRAAHRGTVPPAAGGDECLQKPERKGGHHRRRAGA